MKVPSLTQQLNMTPEAAARRLLGATISRQLDDGEILRAKIVEVEAYHESDEASHARSGPTGRARTMFGPAGHLYVYFTYGLHHCCNVTTGADGEGAGVLIRAVEPLQGEAVIRQLRGGKTGPVQTNGPGKVCQALAIDRQFDGHDLTKAPILLTLQEPIESSSIVQTRRIGISRAIETTWRFYIKDNTYVSK